MINDAYGHSVGDKILVKIASRLNEFESKKLQSQDLVVMNL